MPDPSFVVALGAEYVADDEMIHVEINGDAYVFTPENFSKLAAGAIEICEKADVDIDGYDGQELAEQVRQDSLDDDAATIGFN
ncbi:hypothetical protein Z052_01835 [Halorubrum sp. C191]|nr:hypothetical protein Z052_01835 [Halorubrum sp. C191]